MAASLDLFTLVRGTVWRAARYVAFFASLAILGMSVKSLLNWANSFEVAFIGASVWAGLLLSGPIEAWSQRSLRRSKFMARETLLAGAFAALWAATVTASIGALLFQTYSNLAALTAGSGLFGLVLATMPYTTGSTIE